MAYYKILRVDLTHRTSQEIVLEEDIGGKYLGGRGLGVKLLWDYVDKGTDPLSPENKIIFTVGPLQGTNAFFSNKSVLCTKSPLTDIYLYTVAGGTFGINLRKCGYYGLMITGASKDPVYLWIKNSNVEFKDATYLWGTLTTDAQELILDGIGDHQAAVLAIGPAGENLVKFAGTITGGSKRRSYARGGSGAVMGSKKLKAIAIKGDMKVDVAAPDLLRDTLKEINTRLAKDKLADNLKKYGTGYHIEKLSEIDILPTRNWQSGCFEAASQVCTLNTEGIYTIKHEACGPHCPMPCGKISLVRQGPYAGALTRGPDYDTIYAFGPCCGVGNFDAIIAADRLCDDLGMDSISTGVSIAFAMECFERGIITKRETDGVELRFGNHQAMVELIPKIAYREGLGALLAEGVKRAAQALGKGTERFAMHAKGMEFGGYEGRAGKGQALQMALGSRGGCHHSYGLLAMTEMSSWPLGLQTEGKARLLKTTAMNRIMCDMAVLCTFPSPVFDFDIVAKLVSAVSGSPVQPGDLSMMAERVLTLERAFNVREGLRRQDDVLPKRLHEDELPEGLAKGAVLRVAELEGMKSEFYQLVGWDIKTGIPTLEELERLGLEFVAKQLGS